MPQSRPSPLLVLILLWIVFGSMIVATYAQWPASVATHFDLRGNPDGWMDRIPNIVAYVVLGVALPLLVYGIFCLGSLFPARLVNIPRREYWLAPERRDETLCELRRQSIWLGSLILLFVMGLYAITLEANQHFPPRLSSTLVLLLLGGFLAGLAIWVVSLLRRFWKAE